MTRSTPATAANSASASENTAHPDFTVQIQSGRFHDDESLVGADEMNRLLVIDLSRRITEVGDGIAADLFPDEAFDQFVKNFCGSFISSSKLFDPDNFKTDSKKSVFLNQMVTTITLFLSSTQNTSLVPLRYFTAIQSRTAIIARPGKAKPNVTATPLIDGCIQKGKIDWKDVRSIIEVTHEKKPPPRMARTVSLKST